VFITWWSIMTTLSLNSMHNNVILSCYVTGICWNRVCRWTISLFLFWSLSISKCQRNTRYVSSYCHNWNSSQLSTFSHHFWCLKQESSTFLWYCWSCGLSGCDDHPRNSYHPGRLFSHATVGYVFHLSYYIDGYRLLIFCRNLRRWTCCWLWSCYSLLTR